jgi:hypothetical protein
MNLHLLRAFSCSSSALEENSLLLGRNPLPSNIRAKQHQREDVALCFIASMGRLPKKLPLLFLCGTGFEVRGTSILLTAPYGVAFSVVKDEKCSEGYGITNGKRQWFTRSILSRGISEPRGKIIDHPLSHHRNWWNTSDAGAYFQTGISVSISEPASKCCVQWITLVVSSPNDERERGREVTPAVSFL